MYIIDIYSGNYTQIVMWMLYIVFKGLRTLVLNGSANNSGFVKEVG